MCRAADELPILLPLAVFALYTVAGPMDAMAKTQPLKLSDLRPGTEYPMGNRLSDGRCLIHVKLTDPCVKSIESLINSDKGAFFSLWFEENGGTMSVPSSGGSRKFQFKTAPEGQGSLECVHQELDHSKHHQLTCLGPLIHRLTVQATDDVYDRTKKLMKEAEEQRKEARAQEIKLPSSKGHRRTKNILAGAAAAAAAGGGGSGSGGGALHASRKPPGRTPAQHRPPPTGFTPKPSPAVPFRHSTPSSTRNPQTLKKRIIHLLALKPQKRNEIVARLKKDTKRSESALTNLDCILNEVSDNQYGTHSLKPKFFSELRVDEWPFYSEVERQLVRRNVSAHAKQSSLAGFAEPSGDIQPPKRPLTSSTAAKHSDTPPKKRKLSHSSSSSSPQSFLQDTTLTSTKPPPTSSSSHLIHTSTPSSQQKPSPLAATVTHSYQQTAVNTTASSRTPQTSQAAKPPSSTAQPQPHSTPNLSQSHPHLYHTFVPASSSSMSAPARPTFTNTTSPSHRGMQNMQQMQQQRQQQQQHQQQHQQQQHQQQQQQLKQEQEQQQQHEQEQQKSQQQQQQTTLSDQPTDHVEFSREEKRKKEKKKEKRKKKTKDHLKDKHLSGIVESVPQAGDFNHHGSRSGDVGGTRGEEKGEEPMEGSKQPSGSDPSSTSSDPDYYSQFPPITSDQQRMDYKRVFNQEYDEYLKLKESIDLAFTRHHQEYAALRDKIKSAPKHSEEAKVVKKRLHDLLTFMQKQQAYQDHKEQRRRFEELHCKLGHIKEMVMKYDSSHVYGTG